MRRSFAFLCAAVVSFTACSDPTGPDVKPGPDTTTIPPKDTLTKNIVLSPAVARTFLWVGEKKQFTASVQTANVVDGTTKVVTWTSTDPSVLTVENGQVTARSFGYAEIWAISDTVKVVIPVWVSGVITSLSSAVNICPTPKEREFIDRVWKMEFSFDSESGSSSCLGLSNVRLEWYRVLLFVSQYKSEDDLIWGNKTPLEWLVNSGASGLRVRNDITGSFCCDGDKMINVKAKIVSAYSQAYTAVTLINGASLLIHEARHADGNHPHTCGPEKDKTLTERGSYGVEYEFKLSVLRKPRPLYLSDTDWGGIFSLSEGNRKLSFCEVPPAPTF